MKLYSLLFFIPLLTLAQAPSRLIYVMIDPSGSCNNAAAIQWNPTSGNLFGCVSGTWTKLNGSGGALPGTVVQTNQANTYGAFLQDFSASTMKLPSVGVSTLGNVGIGTTSPSGKLNVDATSGNVLNLTNNGTSEFAVNSSGQITTNLQVTGMQNNNTITSFDSTTNGKLIYSINDAYGQMYTLGAYPLRFGTNNTLYMGIGATGGFSFGNGYLGTDPGAGNMIISGNVGIGTTSPGAKLDVTGNASAIVARFYDQTASTGLTKVTVQDGAGQSTTPSLRITNNAGTAFSVAARGAIGTGIILTDSAGACWNIVPAVSTGVLTSTTITCPTVP